MKSLILASGFGTRLYPLTISRAKGLLEYKGKALITHIAEKIPRDIDILVNTISRQVTLCVEPVFSEEQKFGAIGSIDYWIKARNITEDLLVIASDNYFEFDLSRFIAGYNGKNTLVAVYNLDDISKASQFGVIQLEGQRIIAFEEKPAEPKSSLIATACYILPQRVFPLISQHCAEGKRDNLGSFIAYLMDKDEVCAHAFSELWFDAGSTGLPFLSV